MEEFNMSLEDIENLFQEVIVGMLGFSDDDELKKTVRPSWPTKGMPGWKVDESVIFIRVREGESEYNKIKEPVYETISSPDSLVRWLSYTRQLELNLIFYGPNSFDYSQLIRDSMFYDEYRLTLSKYKIFLIPDITAPTRAPELYNAQWWQRWDLTLKFNQQIIRGKVIDSIESIDILLYEGDKGDKIAEIKEGI